MKKRDKDLQIQGFWAGILVSVILVFFLSVLKGVLQ